MSIGTLPGSTGATGIAQIGENLFAVTGGISNMKDESFNKGSMRVYTVDYSVAGSLPIIKQVALIKDTEMLNGMAALPDRPGVVLSVDSYGGRIFRINTETGQVDVAWQDETLVGGNSINVGSTQLGGNGLKIHNGYLYFTSSAWRYMGRAPIDADGQKTGPVQTRRTINDEKPYNAWRDDDFTITDKGEIFLARHPNELVRIPHWFSQEVIINHSSDVTLHDPTSVGYDKSRNTIYIVTAGAFTKGEGKTGGQIIEIDLLAGQ